MVKIMSKVIMIKKKEEIPEDIPLEEGLKILSKTMGTLRNKAIKVSLRIFSNMNVSG